MKFNEYIKQLNEYAPNNIVSINYKSKRFLYSEEANNDYDNLNVTGDGFIKIKEYLDWNVVGVEVFLSDIDEKSNCFVLEILKMKQMSELKSKKEELESIRRFEAYLEEREKELNQKAQQEQQELDEYNALRNNKENNMYMIGVIISIFLVLGFWLLTKIC